MGQHVSNHVWDYIFIPCCIWTYRSKAQRLHSLRSCSKERHRVLWYHSKSLWHGMPGIGWECTCWHMLVGGC